MTGHDPWGNPPPRQLEKIESLLDGVLGRFAGTKRSAIEEITRLWPDVAGPDWAAASPVRVDGTTLFVEVQDGMTASRLQFDAVRLSAALTEAGSAVIAKVQIRVSRTSRRGPP